MTTAFERTLLASLLFTTALFAVPARGASWTAGFAATDATPPVGAPLAGYGTDERRLDKNQRRNKHPYAKRFKPSVGVLDPIQAKAFYLESSEGTRLAIVSLDIVAISSRIRDDLYRRVRSIGLADKELVVLATHTHSGPGALSTNPFWSRFAADDFNTVVYEAVLSRAAEALHEAHRQREAVELFEVDFDVNGVQANRRGRPGHFDPTARVLVARSTRTSAWLGGIVNFAVHGTAHGPENLELSADLPGGISAALEDEIGRRQPPGAAPAVMLFANGAEGDVSPIDERRSDISALSKRVSAAAATAWPRLRSVEGELSIARRRVKLPRARWNFDACRADGMKPDLFVDIFLSFIGVWLPNHVELTRVRLGSQEFVTWPGEPTTALGEELRRRLAPETSDRKLWILGLANEHLGYFTTAAEYRAGGYEACVNFFGPRAGEELAREYARFPRR